MSGFHKSPQDNRSELWRVCERLRHRKRSRCCPPYHRSDAQSLKFRSANHFLQNHQIESIGFGWICVLVLMKSHRRCWGRHLAYSSMAVRILWPYIRTWTSQPALIAVRGAWDRVAREIGKRNSGMSGLAMPFLDSARQRGQDLKKKLIFYHWRLGRRLLALNKVF